MFVALSVIRSKIAEIEPDGLKADKYCGAYEVWKERLEKIL